MFLLSPGRPCKGGYTGVTAGARRGKSSSSQRTLFFCRNWTSDVPRYNTKQRRQFQVEYLYIFIGYPYKSGGKKELEKIFSSSFNLHDVCHNRSRRVRHSRTKICHNSGITLLKKSAFARGLVLVPVGVGILPVLLHFEKFQLSRQRHTILRLTKPDFPVHFHLANSVVRIRCFIRASYPFSCK